MAGSSRVQVLLPSETTSKGDDTRVFSLYMKFEAGGGDEVKFMEVTYTKRK